MEKNPDIPLLLTSLNVAHSLNVVVITDCSSGAMAIDLNLYFR